ncbi:MAG: hypothetical protein NTY47_07635, partial [Candidatus Omnitrophica bacterium]|nr:hypothetical protein [Candidatus Omnitrophota bacterium]
MISPGIRMLLGGGRENFNEFFAENFARFFSNRAALKAFDPMMYYFLSMLTGEDAVASLGLDFAKQRPELTHKIMTLADEQQLALAVDNMMSQRQVYAFMSFAPESLERRILEVCRDSFKDL